MTTSNLTVFDKNTLVFSGPLRLVLTELKSRFDRDRSSQALVFEDATGKQVDFDLRGALDEVLARYEAERTGPGRPKLGVVAREITLLPRHWEWLDQQPAGASAAIRRLVDEARKRDPDEQHIQRAIESAGRILTALAGNLAGFEQACRALYARNWRVFDDLIQAWPKDIQLYAHRLLQEAVGKGARDEK